MKFLADEDFPKPLVVKIRQSGFSVKTIQQKNLQAVIFHFPKIPTSEIIPSIENFLNELKQIKLSKGKTLKFNKNGLEEQKI